jgi:hypothetical protein
MGGPFSRWGEPELPMRGSRESLRGNSRTFCICIHVRMRISAGKQQAGVLFGMKRVAAVDDALFPFFCRSFL